MQLKLLKNFVPAVFFLTSMGPLIATENCDEAIRQVILNDVRHSFRDMEWQRSVRTNLSSPIPTKALEARLRLMKYYFEDPRQVSVREFIPEIEASLIKALESKRQIDITFDQEVEELLLLATFAKDAAFLKTILARIHEHLDRFGAHRVELPNEQFGVMGFLHGKTNQMLLHVWGRIRKEFSLVDEEYTYPQTNSESL